MDDRDRVQITQDIRRLNMRDKAPPCSRQRDYWERRNLPSSKPRAKSEYSYLDKVIHGVFSVIVNCALYCLIS